MRRAWNKNQKGQLSRTGRYAQNPSGKADECNRDVTSTIALTQRQLQIFIDLPLHPGFVTVTLCRLTEQRLRSIFRDVSASSFVPAFWERIRLGAKRIDFPKGFLSP
jgi:hypothetical protein